MGKVDTGMKCTAREVSVAEETVRTVDHLQKVKDFHNADASRYRAERYRSDTCEGLAYVTRRQVVLSLAVIEPGRVLDVGCGPGILTRDLVHNGHQVYSADLSMEMLRKARETAGGEGASVPHFVVSDASKICFSGNRMDMVLSIGLMCYVKDHGGVLSEIRRVLKPGGVSVIQNNKIMWPVLYRTLIPLYRRLKAKTAGKNYDGLDFSFNFSSSKEFLRDIARSGLEVLCVEHYDFRIPFVDILLPRLSVALGKLMFKNRGRRICRLFAHGLLIKVKK